MSAALGGPTRAGRILSAALDKIIKNAAWRKHASLVSSCKSALDLLATSPSPTSTPPSPTSTPASPVASLPSDVASAALGPLLLALDSASPKVADPALECIAKLLSHHLLLGEINITANDDSSNSNSNSSNNLLSKLFAAVLNCGGLGDDAMELSTLRVLIAAARCPTISLRGESLSQMVKTCYNIYLGSSSGGNQLCGKLVLAQILAIVFARVELDVMEVRVRTVSIADMLDLSDRSLNDSSLVQMAQGFINEVMEGSDAPDSAVGMGGEGEGKEEVGVGLSRIREDGLALFKNLCKLSMKFSTPDNPEDPLLLRGKVLSLELLKMVVDNAGPFWRTNDR